MKTAAKLPRPSSAYREIECPASRRLSERISKFSTFYADEGTAAHELAAICLNDGSDAISHLGEALTENFEVTPEMADNVQEYLDIVREYRDGKLTHEVTMLVEYKFKYGGTLDAVLYNNIGDIHIFDYKNGAQPVSAENNAQMLSYVNSLIKERNMLYNTITLHIVQPNIMKGDIHNEWVVPDGELEKFMEKMLLKAEEAESSYPEMKVGSHCRFCDAIFVCPKLKDEMFFTWRTQGKSLKEMDFTLPAPEDLTPEQISKALIALEHLSSYKSTLYVYALNRAQQGEVIPNFKLTSSLGNRTWVDEKKAIETLKTVLSEEEMYVKKAVTMPQAEKVLQKKLSKGEAAKVLDGLFHRPQGNLKLVPDDADGDAIKTMSVQDRFKQFITKQ